jgi:acyl transferase domain-containing protein
MTVRKPRKRGESIAVIGMAGRFPGAGGLDEFWRNLIEGRESIISFSDEEVAAAGIEEAIYNLPGYVKAGSVLDDIEMFDAQFFGFNPRDAEIMDPQQRIFVENSWECMESAGYNPEECGGLVGVYAGLDMSTYLYQIYANLDKLAFIDPFQLTVGNDKDHIATQTAYRLNLHGPAITVQTACSTSLVAVCLACQSLLARQCDMALAGGAGISIPQRRGYYYLPGSILSPDGHCRTFDASAQGTVLGSGVGVVLLKRLADALVDSDTIRAVIPGYALNNDGATKVGYTAPSLEWQAQAIATAQAMAGVHPESITYLEAHGTATALGDPIEVAALTKVFRASTGKKQYCAIGSLKSNVGHLSSAAGIAGFIKTVLSLENRRIPPSLHYRQPNPGIDFGSSPFFVNTKLCDWDSPKGVPRRAGVSSFGVGGTNAHVIVEEAPKPRKSGPSRSVQLICLSARTETALETITDNAVRYLTSNPRVNLADVGYTYNTGRKACSHRRIIVAATKDVDGAREALRTRDPNRSVTMRSDSTDRPVMFMFSGEGSQYPNMGAGLYAQEPVFQKEIDRCCELLCSHLGFDLREALYPASSKLISAVERLNQTDVTELALFVTEYALARLWMQWGVKPKGMIGHSIGEYVAACLAGVVSLEDALALVAVRGQLMASVQQGAMLAVNLSEAEVQPYLSDDVCLAASNAPGVCTLSGPNDRIEYLEQCFGPMGVLCRRLHTSHAFHSKMVEPILEEFGRRVRQVRPMAPQLEYLSNLTGTWITADEACDPDYWVRHLRNTVRFGDSLRRALSDADWALLEVGPGQTLAAVARSQGLPAKPVVTSLPSVRFETSDLDYIVKSLGTLWASGGAVDFRMFYSGERRRRIMLPTYPFERTRYWIGTADKPVPVEEGNPRSMRDVSDWCYRPIWKPAHGSSRKHRTGAAARGSRYLVFMDPAEKPGAQLIDQLRTSGAAVTTVVAGPAFVAVDETSYTIRPDERSDYQVLFRDLAAAGQMPSVIVHLWNVAEAAKIPGAERFEEWQVRGFHSLLRIAKALVGQSISDTIRVVVFTTGLQMVNGDEPVNVNAAPLLGPCKVIPQEYPGLWLSNVDFDAREFGADLADQMFAELTAERPEPTVAYRKHCRLVQDYEQLRLTAPDGTGVRLRHKGVYLITGGLGNIGLTLAKALAETVKARLVLVGRSETPSRERWESIAQTGSGDVARRVRKLLELEELGATVLVCSADVTDRGAMCGVIEQAIQRFDAINGVIHGAANLSASAFTSIGDIDELIANTQFAPKVEGVVILDELLRDHDLDFILLLSSLSAVLGGLNLTAYASANLFLDSFAASKNQTSSARWISVNWDAWQFPEVEAHQKGDSSILPSEGAEAFRRIIELAPPRVVISTTNLRDRLARWIELESVRSTEQTTATVAGGGSTKPDSAMYTRPHLSSQYAPPTNKIEKRMVPVWEQLLGVAPIGIHDKFFDLGGHSLLAIQFMSSLREIFRIELPVQHLFESPTISQLAVIIERSIEEQQKREQQSAEEMLTEVIKLVEGLSDEEVARMLEEHSQQQEGTAHGL